MRTGDPFPAKWGRSCVVQLRCPGDELAVELPPWQDMMLPGSDGRYHHGTKGSIAPGTLVLAEGREIGALADVVPLYVSNLYADDAEYVLAIRLREIVDAARWARLPWAAFRPPTVVYAVDKFHDTAWSREPGVDATISYGGGWDDLQQLADEESTPACSDPPWIDPALPPSDGAMIRATMRGDAARLRALIARAGNLRAGVDPPSVRNGLTLGASWPSHHNLLVLAIDHAAPTEVLEILLDAGLPADFDAGPSSWTALHAAVSRGLTGHVDVLLCRGADPTRTINGLDAIELARQRAPALVDLLTAHLAARRS